MNELKVLKYDDFEDVLDELMEQYQSASACLILQDAQNAEQAFLNAQLISKERNLNDLGEKDFIEVITRCIEVMAKFMKALVYVYDERHKSSLKELEAATNAYEEATIIINRLPELFYQDKDYSIILYAIKFQLSFLNHIIIGMKETTQKAIDVKEGKFVNEVELYRNAAAHLRSFNFQKQSLKSLPGEIITIPGTMGFLNRLAEVNEKKAERLEEKQKVIEFVKPIDRKIFIVHGHNEGVLRELKSMLENDFKISPIVLRDEIDDGKTVIEKMEHYGRLCAFAFVIITPDDIAENKKKKILQPRPNVLFELGWFCGRYGRSKVRILRQKKVELPSDLGGLVTIDFEDRVEEVFRKIKTDLETYNLV